MTSRLDGYIRVSQVAGRSGDRFQSPGQQRESITAWARANGVTIAAWHEDLDQSGGTMDRPGIHAILERVEAEKTGGIVVARLDRFARTIIGGLTTIERLHQHGARVVSVAESIDPATPMGRAMLGLLLLMAQWQRDQADEHLAAAQARAASAGRFPGKPAYGYRRTSEGLTVVDETAAAVVRRIFDARAAGTGWQTIAADLTRDGVPTSTARAKWSASTVRGIIRSESSLGVFIGPRELRIEGAWPAIIDRDVWERANGVRGTTDSTRRHRDRLYAGLVRCAGCRYVMVRAVNPEGFISYRCANRSCEERASIGAVLLDTHVTGVVDGRLARIALEPRPVDGEGRRLVAARDAAERELEAWRNDLGLRDALGERDWRDSLLERARARDDAEVALAEFGARGGLLSAADVPGVQRLALDVVPWDERRRVVVALLHSVWVRRSQRRGAAATRHVADRVRVVWADDGRRPVFPLRRGAEPGPLRW